MPEWAIYAVAVVAGYLAGSIPFGLVLVKAAGLGDVREIGSKSIGATNVLRTGRKDLAFATLLLEPLHGLVVGAPVWLGMFALTRISSLSALTAAVAVPPGAYLLGERSPIILGGLAALSVLVFWTHRANIARLLNGTEPRFGSKKKDAAEG
ncbi:MAG: glycerol-3-phosphate acyltransferase [Hyphomonas sp. 32-62-5]|nr:MAG: glycerol-3-phosphate acyltransferase [Hyphomonas sp. 32-62-5]